MKLKKDSDEVYSHTIVKVVNVKGIRLEASDTLVSSALCSGERHPQLRKAFVKITGQSLTAHLRTMRVERSKKCVITCKRLNVEKSVIDFPIRATLHRSGLAKRRCRTYYEDTNERFD